MMRIMQCDNCDGEIVKLGDVSVTVEMSKSNQCKHCYQSKTETKTYFFCSEKCFKEYIKKGREFVYD
jgi:YHS domain-containing protein